MKLTPLTQDRASQLAVEALGLDPETTGLTSTEGIAASLRRAASFTCPASPAQLIDATLSALQSVSGGGPTRENVSNILDQILASGDLLELRQEGGRSTRLLYLAPPSYVEQSAGTYIVMGIRPYGAPLIDDNLARAIDYEGATRVLSLEGADLRDELRERGLHAIPKERWVRSPAIESPDILIARYRARLDSADPAGRIDNIILLDPATRVNYYLGRWREPSPRDNGDFVSRRPQAYGNDLWCITRFVEGEAQYLIDLPIDNPVEPGRDEAWRYQAAVDSLAGSPQRFRASVTAHGTRLDFFLPLPGFAERYLQCVGLALDKSNKSLFSYRVPNAAADEATAFLIDMLWMSKEEATDGA